MRRSMPRRRDPVGRSLRLIDRIAAWRASDVRLSAADRGPGERQSRRARRWPSLRRQDPHPVDGRLRADDPDCHPLANTVAAGEAGVGARVLDSFPAVPALVLEYIAGRTLCTEDLSAPDYIPRIGAAIRRLHAEVPPFGNSIEIWDFLARYLEQVEQHGLPRTRRPARRAAGDRADRDCPEGDRDAARREPQRPVATEPDGRRRARPGSIDYDFSGAGDPCFDLGDVAMEGSYSPDDLERLCENYWRASAARCGPRGRGCSGSPRSTPGRCCSSAWTVCCRSSPTPASTTFARRASAGSGRVCDCRSRIWAPASRASRDDRGHRGPAPLPSDAGHVIVGAGAVGCSVAAALARAGRSDVLVLDVGADIAQGTTSMAFRACSACFATTSTGSCATSRASRSSVSSSATRTSPGCGPARSVWPARQRARVDCAGSPSWRGPRGWRPSSSDPPMSTGRGLSSIRRGSTRAVRRGGR